MWLTGFPIKPGWYWHLVDGTASIEKVIRLKDGPICIAEGDGNMRYVENCGGQWAGPLEPPTKSADAMHVLVERSRTDLRATILGLPLDSQDEIFAALKEAILYRGWDTTRGNNCHACKAIEKMADILADNGHEYPIYT